MLNMQTGSMENIEKTVGEQISRLRKKRGLTQKALAVMLTQKGFQVDSSAISRIEKGERALRITECVMIADALETDLTTLLTKVHTTEQRLRAAHDNVRKNWHDVSDAVMALLRSQDTMKYLVEEVRESEPSPTESIVYKRGGKPEKRQVLLDGDALVARIGDASEFTVESAMERGQSRYDEEVKDEEIEAAGDWYAQMQIDEYRGK